MSHLEIWRHRVDAEEPDEMVEVFGPDADSGAVENRAAVFNDDADLLWLHGDGGEPQYEYYVREEAEP